MCKGFEPEMSNREQKGLLLCHESQNFDEE
jgi:hypothetical protein